MRVTSVSKIAEYRAALRGRIEVARNYRKECKLVGDTDQASVWFGVMDGTHDALALTKMLD